jgi:hypothetical protein
MIIYIVSDGSYSDYEIEGIYSTREKAEEAKVLFNADNDIEEREVDAIPAHPVGLLPWTIQVNADGSVLDSYRRGPGDPHPCWMPTQHWDGGLGRPCVSFFVWARDGEHATKIANDKRRQLIAENLWTTDWKTFTALGKEGRLENGPGV